MRGALNTGRFSRQVYRLLDRPWLYHLAGRFLAPGAEGSITRRVRELFDRLPEGRVLLDVGCGPSSWLTRAAGKTPIGADVSRPYLAAYRQSGAPAVLASAQALPFRSAGCDGVWCIGMLHHLPDPAAAQAVSELVRVTRAGGYVILLDAVTPRSVWTRPLAHWIRRMDRGKFMRTAEETERLLPDRHAWSVQRWTYSLTGLEMLTCLFVKRQGPPAPSRAGPCGSSGRALGE